MTFDTHHTLYHVRNTNGH